MNEYTITLITATTALIAGIGGPFVAYLVARKQIRASVISNNREQWIVALRDALAEYIAIAASAPLVTSGTRETTAIARSDPALVGALERGLLVKSKIFLMTDPRASADEELHGCIESVHSALVKREVLSPPEWRARIEAVVHAGRAVLRAEWARVKRGD